MLAGCEAEGQGAIGCHLQQDQQRQQGRGDQAHHGHPGDLHCHGLPGGQFHPGEEEKGGRVTSKKAALKALAGLMSLSICSSVPVEAKPGEMPTGLAGALLSAPLHFGPSQPSAIRYLPHCSQLPPAQEMPPGSRWSGRPYLSTSSTREARGTSRTSWTLDGREGKCQRLGPHLRHRRLEGSWAAELWCQPGAPSGGAAGDAGRARGHSRGDQQHQEHHRYHEHPVGEETAISHGHRREGPLSPSASPRTGDAQPCPDQILTAGPEGPGRPLSPGSPRGPWAGDRTHLGHQEGPSRAFFHPRAPHTLLLPTGAPPGRAMPPPSPIPCRSIAEDDPSPSHLSSQPQPRSPAGPSGTHHLPRGTVLPGAARLSLGERRTLRDLLQRDAGQR